MAGGSPFRPAGAVILVLLKCAGAGALGVHVGGWGGHAMGARASNEGVWAARRGGAVGSGSAALCFGLAPSFLPGALRTPGAKCGPSARRVGGVRLADGGRKQGVSGMEMSGGRSGRGAGGGGDGGKKDKPMLFVGNLPWILDSWGLEKLFEPFGKVISAKISFDHRTDRSRGYGFVVFDKWASAKDALARMKQKEVGGRRIDVQPAGAAPRVAARNDDIDEQAMRVNPANQNARFGQAPSSTEKQMFQNTMAAMDLDFWDKFSDPYYNVSADDWAPCIIEDEDDDLDWTDYKLTFDYYDPIDKELKRGAELEPLREAGEAGRKINWDEDFCADPVQILSDGREYMLNDPDRPVPENFDQIFVDNDIKRTQELMDWDGETEIENIEDLRVATRGDSDKRQRRPGDMNNQLNIVDPFGKRTVRRGLREKASAQMGSIDRMKEMEDVLKRAGTKLPLGRTNHTGLTEDEQRRMKGYEAEVDKRTQATARGGAPASRWTVVKRSPSQEAREKPTQEDREKPKSYVPPKDGYMLVPPEEKAAPANEANEGVAEKAESKDKEEASEVAQDKGVVPDAVPKAKAAAKKSAPKKAAAKKSVPKEAAAAAAGEGEEAPVVKKSRGRPRKDGTPAQPRKASAAPKASAASGEEAPKKGGGAKKSAADRDADGENTDKSEE